MTDGVKPLTVEQLDEAEKHALKEGYFHKLIKGADELGNVMIGGNLGQSLSSRIGLDAANGDKGAILWAHLLDITFSPNHPVIAEASDLAQAELVVRTEESSPDLKAALSARPESCS